MKSLNAILCVILEGRRELANHDNAGKEGTAGQTQSYWYRLPINIQPLLILAGECVDGQTQSSQHRLTRSIKLLLVLPDQRIASQTQSYWDHLPWSIQLLPIAAKQCAAGQIQSYWHGLTWSVQLLTTLADQDEAGQTLLYWHRLAVTTQPLLILVNQCAAGQTQSYWQHLTRSRPACTYTADQQMMQIAKTFKRLTAITAIIEEANADSPRWHRDAMPWLQLQSHCNLWPQATILCLVTTLWLLLTTFWPKKGRQFLCDHFGQ